MKSLGISFMALVLAVVLAGATSVMAQKITYDPPDKDAGTYTATVVDNDGNILSKDNYSDNYLVFHWEYRNGKVVREERYITPPKEKGRLQRLDIKYTIDYTYYSNGNKKTSTTSQDDTRFIIKYNEKGEEISKSEKKIDDNGRVISSSEETNIYDDLGRLFRKISEKYDHGKQIAGQKVTNEYEGNNREPSKTITETFDSQKGAYLPPVEKQLSEPKVYEDTEAIYFQLAQGEGTDGIVKVDQSNGDVYVISKYGYTYGGKRIYNSEGSEVYRLTRQQIEKATDDDLKKYAQAIINSSDNTVINGQATGAGAREDWILERLKKLRGMYTQGKGPKAAEKSQEPPKGRATDPQLNDFLKKSEESIKKAEQTPETPPPAGSPGKTEQEKPKRGAMAVPSGGPSFYATFYGGIGGLSLGPPLNLTSNDQNAPIFQPPPPPAASASPEEETPTDPITKFRVPGRVSPALAGGVSLGTWFDYPWIQLPKWTKYFGFSVNYLHYALQYPSQTGTFSENVLPSGGVSATNAGVCSFRSTGSVDTLGFMFKGRYGWQKDEMVPFGRVQAWAGVGPSLNFVSQKPTLGFNNFTFVNGAPGFVPLNYKQNFNSSSATVVGVQVGVGGSYYIFRWLSADAFLQYDHFSPTLNITGPAGLSGKVNLPVDVISVNCGVGVHF